MEMDGSKENDDNVFDTGKWKKNNVSTAVHLEKVEGGDNEYFDKVEGDNEVLEKVEGDNEILEKVDGDTEIVHAEVGDTSVLAVLSKDPEYTNILDEDEIEKIINSACLANEIDYACLASDIMSNDVE
ncbi:hypothetical protein LWI28_015781 [Acer negundo]|uniref:Uncharacterized protein n=1 Tax=Acer negundo TaxID=4023 RepID=A0AAD5IN87_ACENE|nr:hypothetical protein LWI28_015781 [Acer negundo]